MRKLLAATLVASMGGVLVVQALAQPNPNQLISNRKGAMNLQGKYFGPIFAMAQGRANYDAKIVQRNADYLAALSQMPWEDFQPHSLGLENTRAKEEIAKDQAKFRAGAEQLQKQATQLQSAARGGDEKAVKSVALDIARTCNGCHENFTSMNFRFKL
jgi:cytochrome c556